jgi:hypothetical protein
MTDLRSNPSDVSSHYDQPQQMMFGNLVFQPEVVEQRQAHQLLEFVRQQLKDSYSETGRPSIDPELLLRILLIGYLYGITSERRLVEELRMHLACRWFTSLGFDAEISIPVVM